MACCESVPDPCAGRKEWLRFHRGRASAASSDTLFPPRALQFCRLPPKPLPWHDAERLLWNRLVLSL